MSTLYGAKLNDKVAALLFGVLSEEDSNVVACEEKLTGCLAAVDHHRKRVAALREALEALGVNPGDPEPT